PPLDKGRQIQKANKTLVAINQALEDPKTFENKTALDCIVDKVDKLLGNDVDVLKEIAPKLLSTIDRISKEMPLPEGRLVVSTPNVVLAAIALDNASFNGTFFTFTKDEAAFRDGGHELDDTNSIYIPDSLLTSVQNCTPERITFTIHHPVQIFEALQQAAGTDAADHITTKINSVVVQSSVVACHVTDLRDPVLITFVHKIKNAENSRCVFWNNSLQVWSSKGCKRVDESSDGDKTVCACDHMTSFALLMDVYGRWNDSAQHWTALSIISFTGCSVSLVALILTIVIYILYKARPRQTIPSKILINLCVALALSNLVFLGGMQEYAFSNHVACKVVSVLLHYSLLASLCWMLVEGFNMYLALVLVFRTHYSNFVLKCSSVGWGVPLVVVLITLAVNTTDNYAKLESGICWLKGTAFYVAFVAPVCLILLLNVIAFTMVLRVITGQGRKLNRSHAISTGRQLQGAIGVVILLGLTWVFGFLAIDKASVVFSYLFAIFNTLQGLFIFLHYGLLKVVTRASLRRHCCRMEDEASGTSIGQ
ncbi:hypothetical protein BaRGS_00017159, partial [Batillaria attramentaria]